MIEGGYTACYWLEREYSKQTVVAKSVGTRKGGQVLWSKVLYTGHEKVIIMLPSVCVQL